MNRDIEFQRPVGTVAESTGSPVEETAGYGMKWIGRIMEALSWVSLIVAIAFAAIMWPPQFEGFYLFLKFFFGVAFCWIGLAGLCLMLAANISTRKAFFFSLFACRFRGFSHP